MLEHELPIRKVIETETAKKKGLIKFIEGASVFVRLEDAQMPGLYPTPILKASIEYLPKKTGIKFKYDPAKVKQQKSKNPATKLLPKKLEPKDHEKAMNVAFSEEMDITHYSF